MRKLFKKYRPSVLIRKLTPLRNKLECLLAKNRNLLKTKTLSLCFNPASNIEDFKF